MKSYFECIEEIDTLGGEIYRDHAEPDHSIELDGLDLDYSMTRGRLLYRPEGSALAESKPAMELTLINAQRNFHRYYLSRNEQLVVAQFEGIAVRKSERRKPKSCENIEASREIGGVIQSMPFHILTVTGLRRLLADVAKTREQSALTAV